MNRPNKIKNSLRVSFLDGAFASCMTGLTTDYIVPYALALGATNSQVGILSAVPSLSSSVVQLKSADITEKLKSRKKAITSSIFLQALMGLPIILIPYLSGAHPVLVLIICVTIFNSLNAFAGPVWASLMSAYIPPKVRGKYFGWRNKTLGIVTVSSAFLAGFILNYFKHNALRGFLIIFTIAVICRFISWYFLTRMYEPAFKVSKDSYFSFLDFVKRIRESNFARFVIFVASLNFCVNLAAPFFSVFMLRDLKFSYITYTVLVTSVTIANIFTIDRWGKHADKVGNLKVLRVTAFFIAGLPLWWLFNQHPLYLILVQVLGGFAWAGFNLCATNFIYDAVTPKKRVRCIAYFNVFSGIATFAGAFLGGFLINFLPVFLGYRILTLFLIASILRFVVVFLFSGKIKEVRPAQAVTSRDLFYSVVGIRSIFDTPESAGQVLRDED